MTKAQNELNSSKTQTARILSTIIQSCELSLSEHLTICLIEVFQAKDVIGTENPTDSHFFQLCSIDLLYKAAANSIKNRPIVSNNISNYTLGLKNLMKLYKNEFVNQMFPTPGKSGVRMRSRQTIKRVKEEEMLEFTNDSDMHDKQEKLMESLIDEGVKADQHLETGNHLRSDFKKDKSENVYEENRSKGTWNEEKEFK